MESSHDQENSEEAISEKVGKAMADGGVAVAKITGKMVGYTGKLFQTVKNAGCTLSIPTVSCNWTKGLFTGGLRSRWGGETANIKINIAKTKEKIESLYLEIGKQGARLSGVEDITQHESVKTLIDKVKSCENQIQRWESRLKEIGREKEEERKKKHHTKTASSDSADNGAIKQKLSDIIYTSLKTASFEDSSQKSIFDKVAHDLLEDDLEIKLLAAAELGKMGNQAAIPILKEALHYNNVYLSSEVINALINIDNASCLPAFKEHLQHSNHRIRLGCLRGIYKVGGEESLNYLIDGLKDEHIEVRKSSATFLGWLGKNDALSALIQALKDSEQEVKKAAVMSLSILRDPSSVMPLIRELSESSLEIREKIIHALERITGKSVDFQIDASGEQLTTQVETLKEWWQKVKNADVDEILEADETAAVSEPSSGVTEEEDTQASEENEMQQEAAAEDDTADEEEEISEESLMKLLKKDLTQKCEEMNIDFSPDETKADLVKKILN